jgi:hypothetical protein
VHSALLQASHLRLDQGKMTLSLVSVTATLCDSSEGPVVGDECVWVRRLQDCDHPVVLHQIVYIRVTSKGCRGGNNEVCSLIYWGLVRKPGPET